MELPETEHVSDVEWGRSCMILPGARSRFSESLQHRSDTAPTCYQSQTIVRVSIQHKTFLQVFYFYFFN